MTLSIERLDDPRVAGYRALRDRDVRAQHGDAFVAEGEVVLRVLASTKRFAVRSVFVSEKRVDAVQDVLNTFSPSVPVYVAAHELMQEIVGFPIHRGVLALGERGVENDAKALLASFSRDRSVVVAMSGVVNHDNVGAIFRNAAAFGVDAVVMDGETCDPLYRKALRVSVGGSLVVPFARAGNEAALVDVLEAAGYTVFGLSPRGDMTTGELAGLPGRVALLLGAEGPGLLPATLARVQTFRIPMAPGWDSLNVGTTSGIALHWIRLRDL